MTTVGDGLYQFGGMPVGFGLGVGNIYYVYNTTSSSATHIEKRFGRKKYADHSNILHKHTATSSSVTNNGFATALAATVEDRNDYVVVMPSNDTYYISEELTMDKKGVHLVCPAGMGYERGATNAARLRQYTTGASIIAVEDTSIEIAGLYLQNANQGAGITLATGLGYCPNIHHNTFYLIWTSGAQLSSVLGVGDGGLMGSIEHNWFISGGGGAITCAAGVIYIPTSATACKCCHNEITIGNKMIATVGIANMAYKGRTDYNLFSECGSVALETVVGGTITSCLRMAGTGSATGNRCNVATGKFLTNGGQTGVSFNDNMDGITEGTGGITAQLET